MADQFLAEIRVVGFNFAPTRWAFCDGQILPINQNTALFSLLGTMYGGDGRSTFALPNLQGRAVMHSGQGPGLTSRSVGENGGVESVTLSTQQLPGHRHLLRATSAAATTNNPVNALTAHPADAALYSVVGTPGLMSPLTVVSYGNGGPHNNMQPYLTMNFIIALTEHFRQEIKEQPSCPIPESLRSIDGISYAARSASPGWPLSAWTPKPTG